MFFRVLLYGFLAYLLYKIVFDFIIPVYKTTKQVKKGFREMHAKMNEHMQSQQEYGNTVPNFQQNPSSKKTAGDYIDFEEIK